MHNPSTDIKFDLLENGLDFVTSGIQHILDDKSPTSLKYAIIHLSAGVELILKDTLRKEHWSLIFENINTANFSLLKSGEFKSVDFDAILARLQNVCEIELSDKDLSILKQLRRLRNKIEHFEFSLNVPAIKSLSSKVLSILLIFINENIDLKRTSATSKEYIEQLRSMPTKFTEYVKLRNAQIKDVIVKANKKYEIEICPICRQTTLILDDDRLCAFCGFTESPQTIARLYAENILGESMYICMTDGGDFPVMDCIHCNDTDTFVDKGDDYICFNCFETNHKSELKYCSNCGQIFESSKDDGEICGDCIDYLMNKWD